MFLKFGKILLIILFVTAPAKLMSQGLKLDRWEDYSIYQEDYRIDSSLHDKFYIRIKNTNFFKNNEFANEFRIGQSLTGLFLEPTIDYYASTNTRIRAGVHILKYNGKDFIERAAPVLSVQHNINGHINLIFGSLFGTANHGLKEPIFSFEKYLIDNYENGFQVLFDYPDFIGDLWLNWEQYIQEGDPFQEKFTVGLNMFFDLYETNTFKLGIPVQLLFRHTGGQIDSTELPSGTQSNFVQGLRALFKTEGYFVNRWVFEHNWFQFLEINPGNHITVPYGHANFSTVSIDTKIGNLSMSYWKASNFISPHGEILFQSRSQYNPDFYMADREVLSIKYVYHYSINNFLDFILRIEPYYHFHSNRLDHSFGVSLLVDKDFFLAKAISRPSPAK